MARAVAPCYPAVMNDLARLDRPVEAPARFTIDEFMQLVDTGIFEGSKVELAEGVIVRMSPAHTSHMYYKQLVARRLDEVFADQRDERVVHTELSLQLGEATLRDADVGVIRPFAPGKTFADPASAHLLVEIASTTLDYDLNVKAVDYARAGIPHYWVVDVAGRRTHVMSTPLDSDYAERHPVAFGQPLAVPGTDETIVID